MDIDRSALKARSRQIIKESAPKVLFASLLVVALSFLISLLSSRLLGISTESLSRILKHFLEGDPEAAVSVVLANPPSAWDQFLNLLLLCVEIIVSLGFDIFLLNTLRGTEPVLGNLLDGFAFWWKLLIMDFVVGLLVLLWSVAFIIPGIIAAYRYSMARYVLINNPDFGIMDCIHESKRLTNGWKQELFVLDLSFLGWYLLGALPVFGFIVNILVLPYRELTFLQYCERISGYSVSQDEPQET